MKIDMFEYNLVIGAFKNYWNLMLLPILVVTLIIAIVDKYRKDKFDIKLLNKESINVKLKNEKIEKIKIDRDSDDILEKTILNIVDIAFRYIFTVSSLFIWVFHRNKNIFFDNNHKYISSPFTFLFITSCFTYFAFHSISYMQFFIAKQIMVASGEILQPMSNIDYLQVLKETPFSLGYFLKLTTTIIAIIGLSAYGILVFARRKWDELHASVFQKSYILLAGYPMIIACIFPIIFSGYTIDILNSVSLPGTIKHNLNVNDTFYLVLFSFLLVLVIYSFLNWVLLVNSVVSPLLKSLGLIRKFLVLTLVEVFILGTVLIALTASMEVIYNDMTSELNKEKTEKLLINISSIDLNKERLNISFFVKNNSQNTICIRKSEHKIIFQGKEKYNIATFSGELQQGEKGVILKPKNTSLITISAIDESYKDGNFPWRRNRKNTDIHEELSIFLSGYYAAEHNNFNIFRTSISRKNEYIPF